MLLLTVEAFTLFVDDCPAFIVHVTFINLLQMIVT